MEKCGVMVSRRKDNGKLLDEVMMKIFYRKKVRPMVTEKKWVYKQGYNVSLERF